MSQHISHLEIVTTLHELADAEIARHQQRYFKTGPGEYAEGDVFIGVKVPKVRTLVSRFRGADLSVVKELLMSQVHEERLLALLILVRKYRDGDEQLRSDIYNLYLEQTEYINNWDLIDTSAEHIVGAYVSERDRNILHDLVRSGSLWERRISIMATLHFIKKGDFATTLKLAELLLHDREDLIHKAVGWMLREVGNRNQEVEEEFLKRHYKKMPRTMLRYAIEKFPEELRQDYLKSRI